MDELRVLLAENKRLMAVFRSRRAELRAAIEASAAARQARLSSASATWNAAIPLDEAAPQLQSSEQ